MDAQKSLMPTPVFATTSSFCSLTRKLRLHAATAEGNWKRDEVPGELRNREARKWPEAPSHTLF